MLSDNALQRSESDSGAEVTSYKDTQQSGFLSRPQQATAE